MRMALRTALLTGFCVVTLSAGVPPCMADESLSSLFEVAFSDGVWAFSQGDAPEAAEHFQEAVRLQPKDGFARYLLGLCSLRLGMAREAAEEIAASLAAEKPPPVERSRVLVDLGAAQLAAGDVQDAIGTLETALKERASDAVALHHYATALEKAGRREEAAAVRNRARSLQPALDPEDLPVDTPEVKGRFSGSGERLPQWEGVVSLMAAYDSNPNLLSDDLLLPVPPDNRNLVNGRSSDSVASTDLRVSYYPLQRLGGWNLGVDLRGQGSFHRDFQYLDVVRTGAVVHLARGADLLGALEGPLGWARVPQGRRRLSLLLQGGFSELRLDGASYLRTSELAGSVTFSPSPENATRLELHLQDRSYFRHPLADPGRNGEEARIGVRQIRFLGSSDRYVSLGIAASDRNAGSEFDRALLAGEIEAVFPIAPRWRLRLNGLVTDEKFDARSSNLFNPDGLARKDRTWGSSAALAFDLNERLRVLVRGSYQDRDSNVVFGDGLPALDYQRTLLEAGLSWAF